MVFATLNSMRGRRNTSLSVSSTSSSNSTPSTATRDSLNEKRYSSPPPPSILPPPVPVTRSKASLTFTKRSGAIRCCIVFGLVLFVWRWCGYTIGPSEQLQLQSADAGLIGGDALPEEPIALVVSDTTGSPRWTVSIPINTTFPLHGHQYRELCEQGESLRSSIAPRLRLGGRRRKQGYYSPDASFMEVEEGENVGVLPVPQHDHPIDVCESSLTFAMETEHVSFGKTLLMLWLSYGLAKNEGRAFFINDARWPYGSYLSYFTPPPSPGCSPPPPSHVVPCPRSAKHLIVSAATAKWIFGSLFDQEYEQPRKGSEKYGKIFDLARAGYEDLFHLIGEDATYAQQRVSQLKDEAASQGGTVVGMHIRHGDLHPHEFAYQFSYLPLERYTVAAKSLLRDNLKPPHVNDEDLAALAGFMHSPVLLASDDPDILHSQELAQATSPFTVVQAQDRLQLATKAALDRLSPAEPLREPGSAYVKHVDENSGWEGGFYSALFYSLGNWKHDDGGGGNADKRQHRETSAIPEQTLRMRQLVARGYLLDVAILGRSTEGVACAVSAAACRILGVMMGWDAVRDGRWVNVDDGRPWSWDGRR